MSIHVKNYELGIWVERGRGNIGLAEPDRPGFLFGSNLTTTSLTLGWTAASTPDPAKPVTAYKVYEDNVLVATLGNVTSTSLTGRVAGSVHTYQVTATNVDGESYRSLSLNVDLPDPTTPTGGAPNAPTITSGQMISETSARIDWTAGAVDGTHDAATTYKVYRGGTTLVGTVSGSTFTFTETGLPNETPPRTFNYTVRGSNTSGDSPASNTRSLTWQTGSDPQVRFTGHDPYHIMYGFAAPDGGNTRPLWDTNPAGTANSFGSALAIVAPASANVHRYFVGNWINTGTLNGWLANADTHPGMWAWCSFKSDDWAGVAAGAFDSALQSVATIAKNRAAQGKKPFLFAIDHEPVGNSGGNAQSWAAMTTYCAHFFAGYKNNVYSATRDASEGLVWSGIMNGQFWNLNPTQADITAQNQWYPQSLVDAFRERRCVLGVDQYDAMPGGGAGGNNYTRRETEKIENKVQGYIDWARDVNALSIGWGEIGATTSTAGGGAQTPGPLTLTWRTMRENRDIISFCNYFNSGANSRWEWRLIPANYPVTSQIALSEYWPGNLQETGGDTVTAARLAEYKAIYAESISSQWTSPM